MIKSKWELKPQHDVSSLVSTGLSPIVLNVLKNRGLNTIKEIEKFISPSLDDLHDPMEMKGMDKAVHRIQKAMREGESIVVFGDYD